MTCSLIFARRGFNMLADQGERQLAAGVLNPGVLLPEEWFESLIRFISGVLPGWRDDSVRPAQTGETKLTAQLCSRLNSASHRTVGWDFLQFKREEPDEADGRRAIDLTVAPRDSVIWIEGRRYTEYQTLLPIECKRLPTPAGVDRDEREYLYSRFSTTGGIQRFKAGHHGASHNRAAMIGYVQEQSIPAWNAQLDQWIDDLETASVVGWSVADKLKLIQHDAASMTAMLQSEHKRDRDLNEIKIDHLWIEM